MAPVEACLIDVYRTVLACDFAAVHRALAGMAGVPVERFSAAAAGVSDPIGDGRMTMGDGFAAILAACGAEPEPGLVAALVAADADLVVAHSRLYDDTLGFLDRLGRAGLRRALVSNCAENTRPLLARLGLDALVDAVVLSCEVGSAKPQPAIFHAALAALGAEPSRSLLVDDRAEYCAGAVALGIRAVQLVRPDGGAPTAGFPVVGSLGELGDALAAF